MNSPATALPAVKIRGLAKRYGSFEAVADIDLSVRRGEIFALLGPNGTEKTTTIRMIMGILQPMRSWTAWTASATASR